MWSGKQVITHDRACAIIQQSCFESLVSCASIILSMLLMSLFLAEMATAHTTCLDRLCRLATVLLFLSVFYRLTRRLYRRIPQGIHQ